MFYNLKYRTMEKIVRGGARLKLSRSAACITELGRQVCSKPGEKEVHMSKMRHFIASSSVSDI